eukprot:916821-Alexandrium_andersonii.AAC.1
MQRRCRLSGTHTGSALCTIGGASATSASPPARWPAAWVGPFLSPRRSTMRPWSASSTWPTSGRRSWTFATAGRGRRRPPAIFVLCLPLPSRWAWPCRRAALCRRASLPRASTMP